MCWTYPQIFPAKKWKNNPGVDSNQGRSNPCFPPFTKYHTSASHWPHFLQAWPLHLDFAMSKSRWKNMMGFLDQGEVMETNGNWFLESFILILYFLIETFQWTALGILQTFDSVHPPKQKNIIPIQIPIKWKECQPFHGLTTPCAWKQLGRQVRHMLPTSAYGGMSFAADMYRIIEFYNHCTFVKKHLNMVMFGKMNISEV